MTDLKKPCPFCGSEEVHGRYGLMRLSGIAWVECCACGAGTKEYPSEQAAIDAWNQRVTVVGKDNALNLTVKLDELPKRKPHIGEQ